VRNKQQQQCKARNGVKQGMMQGEEQAITTQGEEQAENTK
jgi:hypothetical protein